MKDQGDDHRDQYRLFVLMPFREEFNDVYLLIRDAADAAAEKLTKEIKCYRSDEIAHTGRIMDQIIEAIRSADLLIADLSDTNPNVMYELGLAHTMGKPAIIITQDVHNSPFDVRDFRTILYDRSRLVKDLRSALVASITTIIEDGLKVPTGPYIPLKSDALQEETSRNQVFVSYSHADSEILNRIMIHLKPLEKQGVIDLWVDTRIKAGDRWKDRVKTALASAKVAILLISADFLASDFIVEDELPPLLAAAEDEGTKIIPVIVKPSRFLRDQNLARFQALNDPTQPVLKMSAVEQEELFVQLAEIVEYYHK